MKQQPERSRIGLIGAGRMGSGIGQNLLAKGFTLNVLDASREAVAKLVEKGGISSSDIAELTAHSDVIITCLPTTKAIEDVFQAQHGLLDSARPGTILIDCSTSDPLLTKRLGTLAEARALSMMDAPLFGDGEAACKGTLVVLVGGRPDVLECAQDVFAAFAAKTIPAGPLGSAHTIKLINNVVQLGTHAILCEAFTVAQKLGIDLTLLFNVMNNSGASSNKLKELGPRLLRNDHAVRSSIGVALKDVRLFAALAGASGVFSPMADTARNVFQLAAGLGLAEEHTSRVATVMARVSGTSFEAATPPNES